MEEIINSTGFVKWLKKYEGKDNPNGDLYYDINRDESFPYDDSYEKVIAYLNARFACDKCIEVFKRAWKRYEKYERKK